MLGEGSELSPCPFHSREGAGRQIGKFCRGGSKTRPYSLEINAQRELELPHERAADQAVNQTCVAAVHAVVRIV